VPVCSAAYRDRMAVEGVTLDRTSLLHVNADDPAWIGWPIYLKSLRLSESRAPSRRFTNYVQATQAALDGQGVMLGWESITGDLVRDGRLVELDTIPLVPSDAFYLVSTTAVIERPAARLLGDWLLGRM
jgi:LysR family glycine cleavage system transcriptional activator